MRGCVVDCNPMQRLEINTNCETRGYMQASIQTSLYLPLSWVRVCHASILLQV